MSSANPNRGLALDPSNNDTRNLLLLQSMPVIQELAPRVIVIVPQILTRTANEDRGGEVQVEERIGGAVVIWLARTTDRRKHHGPDGTRRLTDPTHEVGLSRAQK